MQFWFEQHARILSALLCASAIISLFACESQQHSPPPVVIRLPERSTDEAIKVQDLATAPPPASERLAAPLAPRRVIVQIMAYERDSPRLPVALGMLDEADVTSPAHRLWKENGLLLASTERQRLPLLMANLGKPLVGQVVTLYNAQVDNPVTLIERVNARQHVEVIEADGSIQPRQFFGGEYRVLFKIIPPADSTQGPTRLELLPQHFSRSRSVLLTPQTQARESLNFDQLHIDLPLGEDQVWLITADPSPPHIEPLEDKRPEPRSSPRPVSLGHAMLTGDYRAKPIRLIILIALEEPIDMP